MTGKKDRRLCRNLELSSMRKRILREEEYRIRITIRPTIEKYVI